MQKNASNACLGVSEGCEVFSTLGKKKTHGGTQIHNTVLPRLTGPGSHCPHLAWGFKPLQRPCLPAPGSGPLNLSPNFLCASLFKTQILEIMS